MHIPSLSWNASATMSKETDTMLETSRCIKNYQNINANSNKYLVSCLPSKYFEKSPAFPTALTKEANLLLAKRYLLPP
jgi:hypothetical protein